MEKGGPGVDALFEYFRRSPPCLKNGQILGGVEIPTELLETILATVGLDDLLQASKVCIRWKDIIRNPVFWKGFYKKCSVKNSTWSQVHDHVQGRPDEWAVHFAVVKQDVFGKNLLVNPFGADDLQGWKMVSGENRSISMYNLEVKHGWSVVDVRDTVVRGFPAGLGPSTCFATDAYSCSKEQQVDLWAAGFTPAVMRASVPFTIEWGAYVGTPEGHEGFHEMNIRLLDKSMEELSCSMLHSMNQSTNIPQSSPFAKYGGRHVVQGRDAYEIVDKLRYVYFYHGGMASDSEAGYNGPHIYLPKVTIQLGRNFTL